MYVIRIPITTDHNTSPVVGKLRKGARNNSLNRVSNAFSVSMPAGSLNITETAKLLSYLRIVGGVIKLGGFLLQNVDDEFVRT